MSQNKAKISGKSIALESPKEPIRVHARPGGWLILESTDSKGHIYRSRVMIRQTSSRFWFHSHGKTSYGDWVQSQGSSVGAGSANDLTAQFPGKVRKLLIKEGVKVSEGDPLLLVEAMKMEFTVKAPSNGKVKAILVTEGQQLTPGTLLIDFEAQT